MLRVVLTVCCVCVACELHGRATQHSHRTSKARRLPHKRVACIPKCCTCHTNTSGTFFLSNLQFRVLPGRSCCILCPTVSQCSWSVRNEVVHGRDSAMHYFVSYAPGRFFDSSTQDATTIVLQGRSLNYNVDTKNLPRVSSKKTGAWHIDDALLLVRSPLQPLGFGSCN